MLSLDLLSQTLNLTNLVNPVNQGSPSWKSLRGDWPIFTNFLPIPTNCSEVLRPIPSVSSCLRFLLYHLVTSRLSSPPELFTIFCKDKSFSDKSSSSDKDAPVKACGTGGANPLSKDCDTPFLSNSTLKPYFPTNRWTRYDQKTDKKKTLTKSRLLGNRIFTKRGGGNNRKYQLNWPRSITFPLITYLTKSSNKEDKKLRNDPMIWRIKSFITFSMLWLYKLLIFWNYKLWMFIWWAPH